MRDSARTNGLIAFSDVLDFSFSLDIPPLRSFSLADLSSGTSFPIPISRRTGEPTGTLASFTAISATAGRVTLQFDRNGNGPGQEFASYTDPSGHLYTTPGRWTVAHEVKAPEPTTVALVVMGVVCCIAYYYSVRYCRLSYTSA